MTLLKAEMPAAKKSGRIRPAAQGVEVGQRNPEMRRVAWRCFDAYRAGRMQLRRMNCRVRILTPARRIYERGAYLLQTDFSPSYAAVPLGMVG